MSLLYPSYLWGLLGLATPVAIHLWSKKEGRVIKIGSIQLLDKGNTKKASSIQINEIFLLILRLLLISLLVFIMAGAKWKEKSTRVPLVYLIEPALLSDAQIREALDTISEQKVFLLKKGFPVWDREKMQKKQPETPNYWQLAQDFENLNADSLVVYSRALEQGIHGKRPSIGQNINWVILNPETLNNEPFLAINRIDSIEIVGVTSDSDQLLLEKENFDKASGNFQVKSDSLLLNRSGKRFQLPLFNVDTLRVQVSASDSFNAEEKYLTSALNALSIYLKRPFHIYSSKDSIRENLNLIIWLHEDSINLSNVPV
ncbi:MAG: BatA domain-containing protein, partial [Leeuwenhoekiella sp.]